MSTPETEKAHLSFALPITVFLIVCLPLFPLASSAQAPPSNSAQAPPSASQTPLATKCLGLPKCQNHRTATDCLGCWLAVVTLKHTTATPDWPLQERLAQRANRIADKHTPGLHRQSPDLHRLACTLALVGLKASSSDHSRNVYHNALCAQAAHAAEYACMIDYCRDPRKQRPLSAPVRRCVGRAHQSCTSQDLSGCKRPADYARYCGLVSSEPLDAAAILCPAGRGRHVRAQAVPAPGRPLLVELAELPGTTGRPPRRDLATVDPDGRVYGVLCGAEPQSEIQIRVPELGARQPVFRATPPDRWYCVCNKDEAKTLCFKEKSACQGYAGSRGKTAATVEGECRRLDISTFMRPREFSGKKRKEWKGCVL